MNDLIYFNMKTNSNKHPRDLASRTSKGTIHVKVMASDKLRVTGGQKQHSIRHMLGSEHHPFQPRELPIILLHLLFTHPWQFTGQGGCQSIGWDAVHPNPMHRKLHAGGPHQPHHRMLRHGVVRRPRGAVAADDARRAHYTPPHAPLHHCTRRVFHAQRHAANVEREPPVKLGHVQLWEGLIWGESFVLCIIEYHQCNKNAAKLALAQRVWTQDNSMS